MITTKNMSFLRSVPTSITNHGAITIPLRSILSSKRKESIIRSIAIGSIFSHSAKIGTPSSTAATTTHIATNPSSPTVFEGCSFPNAHHLSRRGYESSYLTKFSTEAKSGTSSSSSSSSSSKDSKDIDYDGVPDDVARLINDHAKQPPTSVSLQALMRTGRGEYLDRHFENLALKDHTATELVLMQVASFLRRELPIRLAHRVQDLEKVRSKKTGDLRSVYYCTRSNVLKEFLFLGNLRWNNCCFML